MFYSMRNIKSMIFDVRVRKNVVEIVGKYGVLKFKFPT